MKTLLKYLILLFVINSSCQQEKEVPKKPYNAELNIIPRTITETKYFPEGLYLRYPDTSITATKLYLVNKHEDVLIYSEDRYTFKSLKSYSNTTKRYHQIISCGGFDKKDGCKIMLKKNDSVAIYMNTYHTEVGDSVYINILWKRDSLGLDELVFYKTLQGEIKYHSSKKSGRGDKISYYEKIYNCGFLTKQDRDKELPERPSTSNKIQKK